MWNYSNLNNQNKDGFPQKSFFRGFETIRMESYVAEIFLHFYYFNMQARALQSFTKNGSMNLKLWQFKISKWGGFPEKSFVLGFETITIECSVEEMR